MSTKKPNSLLDQEDAVGSYLADMLSQPVQDSTPPSGLLDADKVDNLVLLRQALEEMPDPDSLETESELTEVADDSAVESEPEQVPSPVESEPLDFPLQCLMFSVGRQQLSMPLIQMSGVVETPETLNRLPGSSEAIIGVLQYRDQNVQVIDSAVLLGIKREETQWPKKLIVLQGDKWAITADALASVVVVDESDIKWGKQKPASLTLGTIKSSLAQLLSPESIVRNLDSGSIF